MADAYIPKDIESLARMAARLAGQDPNRHVKLTLAEVVAFEGRMWRYPDFLRRAEAAYQVLISADLTQR